MATDEEISSLLRRSWSLVVPALRDEDLEYILTLCIDELEARHHE